uniref:Cyclic nucleotide-binding domain-containing protein n=1 Tax=Coccolithus braarudii TaxID=221442 RepID=A0A7S0QBE0_9EUKA
MFFLQSGTVEMLRATDLMGGQRVVERLTAMSYFGEIAVVSQVPGQRREASVRAVTFCCLFAFTRQQLQRLFVLFPEAADKLKQQANARLNKVNARLQLKQYFRLALLAVRLNNEGVTKPLALVHDKRHTGAIEDVQPDAELYDCSC